MGKHYHAGCNVPGYLSEGDVPTFSNRREAARYARQEARETYENRREYRDGSYWSGRDGNYYIGSADPYDLGISCWVVRCFEADCETQE